VQGLAQVEEGKNQNYLADANVARLVGAFRTFEDEERFARVVDLDEIRDNDHNLNISRYVTIVEPEVPIDMPAELETLRGLRARRDEAEDKMMGLLAELGYDE
ncbi:MAG: SAM-dependent DNA methyltransferase, partial [bacterium]|nr:SAM-dependent DNA methyltransferase [bacterium]